MAGRDTLQRVQVIDISDDGTYAVVQTVHNTVINVTLNLRHGKGAWPQIGEIWLISKQYGQWVFAAIFGDGKPPVINTDRNGADPLALQLLDAMVALGHVTEEGADDDYVANDYSDTDLQPGTASTIDEGDDPVDSGDVDFVDVIPTPLWLATYNTQGASLGNKTVQAHLKRLIAAPGDVLCLQEMWNGSGGPGYRDPVAAYLDRQGFNVIRDESNPDQEWLWMATSKKRITVLSSGMQQIADRIADDHGVARFAQWATLRHEPSGQRFSVINVGFSPPARYVGSVYVFQVQATADLLDSLSEDNPTFVVGSMNVDQRNSSDNTHVGWPTVQFEASGAQSNWTVLGLPTGIGTYGLPLADYVWQGPDDGQIGTMVDQRILKGFPTRHRPLLVEVQMKRKDTDIRR